MNNKHACGSDHLPLGHESVKLIWRRRENKTRPQNCWKSTPRTTWRRLVHRLPWTGWFIN